MEFNAEVILGLAALLTGIAGVFSGVAALRRTRNNAYRTAEEECLQRLRAARVEAEAAAAELHDRRMKELE